MHAPLRLLSWLLLAVLLGSCDADDAILGDPVPNAAPQTRITSTPITPERTSPRVTFYWTGEDPDGEIVGFEWRISSNGRDGVLDIEDTLEAYLPWTFTTARDSTFEVTADLDSFEIDLENPDLQPREIRYWQSHTFQVRAVDEDGRRDPSPAQVSFTATTLAPNVFIDLPTLRSSGSCAAAARVLTFGWRVTDPDAGGLEPKAIRTLLIPLETDSGDCFSRIRFETESPIRGDDPSWGPWIPWSDPASRTITYPRQDVDAKLVFAVQAMDAAGAVTPTFEWERNVRHIEIGQGQLPILRVNEPILGERGFIGRNGFYSYEIYGGQELRFRWEGDASHYAGVIEAYRYGWDLADPDNPNDPGWAVPWGNGPTYIAAPPRSYAAGSPNLIIQCRDNQGQVARGFFQFNVVSIPDRADQRPLLVVDDFPEGPGTAQRALDLLGDRRWQEVFEGRLEGFAPIDILDAEESPERVTLRELARYRSVIWFTSPSSETFFRQNIAPLSDDRINWLDIYQRRAGNVMMVGPGAAFNTIGRGGFSGWKYPIAFDTPQGGQLGFGTTVDELGNRINAGTLEWPYSAWCVELIDKVRPGINSVFGESSGNVRRTRNCDVLHTARVADQLRLDYPSAVADVVDLTPTHDRLSLEPLFKFESEEFYNVNVTSRNLEIIPRDCQTPMFVHRALRDEGAQIGSLQDCRPPNQDESPLDGVPIALLSRVYGDTKPLRGSEDILWGFHPWAFRAEEVQRALLWIAASRWELRVR